jgi:hypothetical protein
MTDLWPETIGTVKEFLEALKIILGSKKIKRVMTALLSQLDSNLLPEH